MKVPDDLDFGRKKSLFGPILVLLGPILTHFRPKTPPKVEFSFIFDVKILCFILESINCNGPLLLSPLLLTGNQQTLHLSPLLLTGKVKGPRPESLKLTAR